MPDEMSLLTFLGESADWLKDAKGVSVRDHRVAAIEAFRAAWAMPTDDSLHEAFRSALTPLFEAARHNQLYPEGALLAGEKEEGGVRYLPAAAKLRQDFARLRDFCVVNKFGLGELHLSYFVFMLCRMHYQPEGTPYDQVLQEAIGDVLLLRVPIYRADNLAPFSSELKAHFHAVRVLRAMKKLGLCDEQPVGKIAPQDQEEMTRLLADPLCPAAGKTIQRPHRAAFKVLDSASALEAFARAHAASRMPLDSRSPEELFGLLRQQLKKLPNNAAVGPARRARLLNLGTAAIVRAVAHADAPLGRSLYAFLRSKKHLPSVRHSRMFTLLPNNSERLRFLNFLYRNGRENPMVYVERFERHFQGQKLHFEHKDVGFSLLPLDEA